MEFLTFTLRKVDLEIIFLVVITPKFTNLSVMKLVKLR